MGLESLLSRIINSIKDAIDFLLSFLGRQWARLEPILLGWLQWLWSRFYQLFLVIKGWVLSAILLVTTTFATLFDAFDLSSQLGELISSLPFGEFPIWIALHLFRLDLFLSGAIVYFGLWLGTRVFRMVWWAIRIMMDLL